MKGISQRPNDVRAKERTALKDDMRAAIQAGAPYHPVAYIELLRRALKLIEELESAR